MIKTFLIGHIPTLAPKGLLFFNSQAQKSSLCLFLTSRNGPTNLPQRTLGLILLCSLSLSKSTTMRKQGPQVISHPHTTPSLLNSNSHPLQSLNCCPMNSQTHKSVISKVPYP